MARVIIHGARKAAESDTGRSDEVVQPNGFDAADFESIGRTFTSEPVRDAGKSTGNYSATSKSESGDDKKFVDPTTGSDSGSDTGTSDRKRRKRSDSGVKRGKRIDPQKTQTLESLLLMVHYGLAGFCHAPKLKLTEQEAHTLSQAINNVRQFYPISILSPVQEAWLGLGIVSAMVYGPKFRKDKPEDKQTQENVVIMNKPVQGDAPKIM